jgi:predicted DNA-binding transcriptional regulator YafY
VERRLDSSQLARQWTIVRLLSSRRAWTIKEVAAELSTSKSTIQRDLATLERLFAVVEHRDGKQRRRYSISNGRAPDVRVGVLELVAIHVARLLVASSPGAPLSSDLTEAANKVAGLAAPDLPRMQDVARIAPVAPERTSSKRLATTDALVDALLRRRTCRVRHAMLGKEQTVIYPIELCGKRGVLFVRARIVSKGAVVELAVHGFSSVELLPDKVVHRR